MASSASWLVPLSRHENLSLSTLMRLPMCSRFSSITLLLIFLCTTLAACDSRTPGTDSPATAEEQAQAIQVDGDEESGEALPGQKAQDEDAKLADIKKLLELTGSAKLGRQTMEFMLGSFKKSMPDVPAEFWDEFMKEVNDDELINLVAPIYAKHYTHEDIKKLIAFYESDIGQKSIQVTPLIVQESQLVGQQWGAQIAEKIKTRLEKKGYK